MAKGRVEETIRSIFGEDIKTKSETDPQFLSNVKTLLFAEAVSKQLKAKNLTKAELAQRLGMSRAYVTQLLKGKPNITLFTIYKVCLAVGLNPTIEFQPASLEPLQFVRKKSEVEDVTLPKTDYELEGIPDYEKAV